MKTQTVYLKCDRNTEVQKPDVFLSDVGALVCTDSNLAARLKAIKIHHFKEKEPKRCVVSTLKIVELMQKECADIDVQIVGETDCLIEWISVKKEKGIFVWIKIAIVCLVTFFGTAFTIMAYHNDVGINEIFEEIYTLAMNKEPQGINVIEIAYSVGLAAGIILFFNHVGGRRITNDPTPIEVSIRKYEEDVDNALIAQAGRGGEEEEAQ